MKLSDLLIFCRDLDGSSLDLHVMSGPNIRENLKRRSQHAADKPLQPCSSSRAGPLVLADPSEWQQNNIFQQTEVKTFVPKLNKILAFTSYPF